MCCCVLINPGQNGMGVNKIAVAAAAAGGGAAAAAGI